MRSRARRISRRATTRSDRRVLPLRGESRGAPASDAPGKNDRLPDGARAGRSISRARARLDRFIIVAQRDAPKIAPPGNRQPASARLHATAGRGGQSVTAATHFRFRVCSCRYRTNWLEFCYGANRVENRTEAESAGDLGEL